MTPFSSGGFPSPPSFFNSTHVTKMTLPFLLFNKRGEQHQNHRCEEIKENKRKGGRIKNIDKAIPEKTTRTMNDQRIVLVVLLIRVSFVDDCPRVVCHIYLAATESQANLKASWIFSSGKSRMYPWSMRSLVISRDCLISAAARS